MIKNAIPAISAPAAITPSSSTVLELELAVASSADDPVDAVLAVVSVAALPPSVNSLNALPPPRSPPGPPARIRPRHQQGDDEQQAVKTAVQAGEHAADNIAWHVL